MSTARALIWRTAEKVGALRAWQLAGSRSTLTVIGLHRVLPDGDDRLPWAIPEFTISDRLLVSALGFLAERYEFVSIAQVLDAADGGRPLPSRALLLTIDDGWSDSLDVTGRILSGMGLPSLLFVAAGLVDSQHGAWQNELHARLHFNGEAALRAVLADAGFPATLRAGQAPFDALCDLLEPLTPVHRRAVLDGLGELPACPSGPQFLSADQLRSVVALGMDIGLHGMSHERLTGAVDLSIELEGARARVSGWLGGAAPSLRALSFPHGRYGPELVARARAAGFDALFTSELTVTPLHAHRPQSPLFGRLWLGQASLADADSRLRYEAMYNRLLRAPRRAPDATPSPWFRA